MPWWQKLKDLNNGESGTVGACEHVLLKALFPVLNETFEQVITRAELSASLLLPS